MGEKCCGTCKFHSYDLEKKDWLCVNEESYCGGCYTEYSETCEDWEEKSNG